MKRKNYKIKNVGEDGTFSAVLSSSRRDKVGDRVLPSAIEDWVENAPDAIPMLREHRMELVTGQWSDFKAEEASDGETELLATGELIEGLSLAADTKILIERGLVKGTSVGFYYPDYRYTDEGLDILALDIREASIVLNPANADATIQASYQADGSLDTKVIEDLLVAASLKDGDIQRVMKSLTRPDPVDLELQLLQALS